VLGLELLHLGAAALAALDQDEAPRLLLEQVGRRDKGVLSKARVVAVVAV